MSSKHQLKEDHDKVVDAFVIVRGVVGDRIRRGTASTGITNRLSAALGELREAYQELERELVEPPQSSTMPPEWRDMLSPPSDYIGGDKTP